MSQLAKRQRRKQLKTIRRPRRPRVDAAGMVRYFAQQPDVIVAYLFGSVANHADPKPLRDFLTQDLWHVYEVTYV